MKIDQLVKEINNSNLSVEDLQIVNQLVVRKIKSQRRAQSITAGASLSVGDVVRINHPKLEGLTAKITKIKQTKCDIVVTSTKDRYTVPMAIVQSL